MSSSHREYFKVAVEDCKNSDALDFKFIFKGSLETAYNNSEHMTESTTKNEAKDKKRKNVDDNKSVLKYEEKALPDLTDINKSIKSKRKRMIYSPDMNTDIKASKLSEEAIRSVPLHIAMQSKRAVGHIKTSVSSSTSTVSDVDIHKDNIVLDSDTKNEEDKVAQIIPCKTEFEKISEQVYNNDLLTTTTSSMNEIVHDLLPVENVQDEDYPCPIVDMSNNNNITNENEGTFITISNIFNNTFEHLHAMIPYSFRGKHNDVRIRLKLGDITTCVNKTSRKQMKPIQNKRRYNNINN
jgi:hypothetical protein